MNYDADLNFTYGHTPRVVFGENSADNIGDVVSELGCSRALIVTDTFLADKTDMVQRLKKSLGPRLAGVFTGVIPDPTSTVVDEASAYAKDADADLLISLGGGSTIDTAKAMAVVMKEGGKLLDHEGYHVLTRHQTPHVAVPTTAGTGSEMTMVTVITDPERGQKTFVGSFFLHPDVAVLDPTLIVGLPAKLTAATGMDAMCHAVESLFSSLRQPLSDAYAIEAIRRVTKYLPQSIQEPNDLKARGQMLIAANMAGTAFSNAMVSLNHAMAHSLGALYHVHHGTLNALLITHTLREFADVIEDELAKVATAMGLDISGMDATQAADAATDRLGAFVKEIGLTEGLAELGVPEEGPQKAGEMAISDGSIIYSPKPVFDPEEIAAIIRKAM